jgi:putative membrane protein
MQHFPKILLGLYLILFVILAINPYDRATWVAENLPVLIAVSILIVWYRSFVFSNAAYFLMWAFLCYHTIGGHWSFERVPFAYGNELLSYLNFDFLLPDGRNNFDRVGHFFVGVFAYPVVEYMIRRSQVSHNFVAFLFAVFGIGFWAASYEIIEMYYAVEEGGTSGSLFLGSQGDIWDAQKDMLLDICGAVIFGLLAIITVSKQTHKN